MLRAIPASLAILWLLFTGVLGTAAWSQTTKTGQTSAPAPAVRETGNTRGDERIRYFDVKHVKAELTLVAKQKEVRGTVTHTLSPLHPYLTEIELDCAPELKVTKVTSSAQGANTRCLQIHDRRRASSSSRSTRPSRPWRHPRPGDRLLGLARQRAAVRSRRSGLSRTADGDLDAGPGRGHALLASLLRLPQRPRDIRDDHHRRQTRCSSSPMERSSRPGRTPAAPRPITGRWMCPTSVT